MTFILLITLAQRLFGSSAELTARDVEGYLQAFRDGTGGDWDWDEFTSIEVADPSLDAIREEAACVGLPLGEDGDATPRRLLAKVLAM